MFQEVGAIDAKTKLSELLREVALGHRYTITVKGKAVGDLVPSEAAKQTDVHASVAAMRAFNKVQGITSEDIEKMISEGRR